MADVSVRPARLLDVEAMVAMQLRAWAALPPGVWSLPPLDQLDPAAMGRSWERAVLLAPSPRHRLLVALDGDTVVGAVALTPSDDPDVGPLDEPTTDGPVDELVLLVVDPAYRRRGHGSRLMTAAADLATTDGTEALVSWLPASDDEARSFLTGAGWAPDGAHRTVEVADRTVRELRFATHLTAASDE